MSAPNAELLMESVRLPHSGLVSRNRLLKAPMEEMLASSKQIHSTARDGADGKVGNTVLPHMPNEVSNALYKHWAQDGWGIIVTGNVAVDRAHLGTPFDIALPALLPSARDAIADLIQRGGISSTKKAVATKVLDQIFPQASDILDAFTRYADNVKGVTAGLPDSDRPLAICQLVHAGRQSMRGSGRAPWKSAWAPSAVRMRPSSKPLTADPGSWLNPLNYMWNLIDYVLFGVPHEMTVDEIQHLKAQFVSGAILCKFAGFDGVELHGSHGYQIAAFLSPKSNTRTDDYRGTGKKRARLLLELVQEFRQACGKEFSISVKLNSADYVAGGLTEEDAIENVRWLTKTKCVDLIEISGGNYENPGFLNASFDAEGAMEQLKAQGKSPSGPVAKQPSERTKKREAFFAKFAHQARKELQDLADQGYPLPILCCTGGMKTRNGMAAAVRESQLDMVGIGRVACVYPDLPKIVGNTSVPDKDEERNSPPTYVTPGLKAVSLLPRLPAGAGWNTIWHSSQLHFIARYGTSDVGASVSKIFSMLSRKAVLN